MGVLAFFESDVFNDFADSVLLYRPVPVRILASRTDFRHGIKVFWPPFKSTSVASVPTNQHVNAVFLVILKTVIRQTL